MGEWTPKGGRISPERQAVCAGPEETIQLLESILPVPGRAEISHVSPLLAGGARKLGVVPSPCAPCPGSPCPAQKVRDQPSGAKCAAAVSVPSKSSDRVAGEGEWPHACHPCFPHRSMFGHRQHLLACLAASESSLQVCTRLLSTTGMASPGFQGPGLQSRGKGEEGRSSCSLPRPGSVLALSF